MRIATSWLVGLLLGSVGCGSEAPAAAPASAPPQAEPVATQAPATTTAPPAAPTPPEHADWLSDDFAKLLPRRAQVARYGHARLRSDVVPKTETSASPPDGHWVAGTVVVAERLPEPSDDGLGLGSGSLPKQVRVVFETPRLRALLWLSGSQLYRTPGRPVRLRFSLHASPTAPLKDEPEGVVPRGVTLEPGARLTVSGTYEGRIFVKAGAVIPGGAYLNVDGWVPRGTPLGLTFVAESAQASVLPKKGPDWTLEDDADVLARPGGAVIARFSRRWQKGVMGVTVTEVRPGPGWMREVVYRGQGFAVRGFVAKNKLDASGGLSAQGTGQGLEGSDVASPNEVIQVPPGTCLYDARAGVAIGVTRVAFQQVVSVPGEEHGWRQLKIASDFRFEPWVRLTDVRTGKLGKLEAGAAIVLEPGKWGCPTTPG